MRGRFFRPLLFLKNGIYTDRIIEGKRGDHMPDNTETYIKVLIDTLKKKEKVLTSLSECTKQQSQLLEADEFDTEAFNSIIEKKDILLLNIS